MEPPSFPAGGPQTVRAAPGSDAHLVVPAPSGTAPFHYQWTRAGAALEGRFKSSDEPGAVRLTVSAARTEDTALYTLQASNAAGSDTARVRLEVSADETPTGDDPPTFLRRLQDLTVKVGTRTRFLVEILSNTECKVTWYRNERRLLEAERVSLARDGNFWCADVAAVSVDDAGRWTCTAENAGGRASCSAHLNVLVPKAYKRPEFVEELRALLTELGTVSLECKVVGVPTPVLRWFKDSREIKAGDVFALTANADDPTSLGTYTCEAVNCMGRAYSSSKVHVVGRASREGSIRPAASAITGEPPPIFTRELEDQFARICEPLTLSCQVVVPPWPRSVVWYNKEGKVEPSERYHVLEDGVGGYMLEIPSAEWADEGEWKCVATSSGGRVGISTCIVSMDVPKNYRKPRFMENLQAVLTEEGLVSFECKVVGFPTPVLSWFKDGQELKPGDVYQLTGTNSLGSYCCIARNCMGQASSSAELTVEDIQNQLNEEEKLQLFSKNQAPKFVQGLKSVESKIDEPFRFTVKVAIPPEPSVLWYRDDQPVDESTRCHLGKEERGVFFLDIETLEFLDQAEWKCVAMNDFGHSVTSCFLKLIIPRHYKKPRFLENLQAILSDEGAVNLECKVIGVPQPVLKWYKDGEELKPGDIHRIISGQDGTCCLGTYTCEASNCMGIAASSASLLGFEDSMKAKEKKKAEEQALQRNLSLSTIHEERTSQMYDTPVGDITLDDKGEISFSFDGKEVSVSLYETPDLTEEEALQIVEMYADQLSENVTEHNVVELPPLRFVKETSTSGNLLMEAIIIDVSPEYFTSPEEDLRTEADVEDISIADENGPPQLSLDQDVDIAGEDYLEKTMALLSEGKADLPLTRKKSDSQKSAEDFFSLSREQSLSEDKKDDDTQALSESELHSFASAHSSGKPKSKSSKPSVEDGQESSEPTKTILYKDEVQKSLEIEVEPVTVKPKRERRSSRGSRRSSSSSEKSISRSKDEERVKTEIKTETKVVKKPSMTDEEFKTKISNISDSLTQVINNIQLIERDIILKSELMSSAATATRSLEIISSLITPLSEIHCIADAAKESAMESKEVSSTLFNKLPQSLKILHQSLTIIDKCLDVESDNRTLVKKTCVSFIETCGAEIQKFTSEIKSITSTDYLIIDDKVLSEVDTLTQEMSTLIKFSADTIKARNLLSEASEIKVEEPSLQTKHLRDTQKAVFELRRPLNSLLRITESANSGKIIEVSKIKSSDVILNDMSASIQDLQTSLEQIESLSVKESTSPVLQKYNTEIIEMVVDSILKLRSSFEKLSTDTKIDDKIALKETLKSIKENLNAISTQIDTIDRNVGTFDVLQSDNKLDVLQKMAQILITLENNLPRLETMPDVKTHMESFHKNLTKVLENVIESNEAKKYFTLIEVCDAVNRINSSIKDMDIENVLPLASLSNTLTIIKDNFINNVFESELNCSVLTNITDVLVGIQEAINKAEEISLQLDSEHVKDLSTELFDGTRANIVVEHIDQTIAAINTVRSIESTTEVKNNFSPVLENICPVLEDLRKYVASIRTGGIEHDEHISDISEASFAETLATPLCELNQNIIILNQSIVENIESLKENNVIISAVAEPLYELQRTLEVIQQEVISQYGEDLTPYEISVNMASAIQNLQSCILIIQEQAAVEGVDEMSTLEDISGIKTTAETLPSDRLVVPTAEETITEQNLETFSEEAPKSAVAQALHILNEHVAVLQNPEVIDVLDTLSEVSDYSSLKSVVLGLSELHSGIQEILHPILIEGSSQIPQMVYTSKLATIAEPLQELQQNLSILEINDIPIYEDISILPAEKLHSVIQKITDFKEYLGKYVPAIFSAIELSDQSIEISNKVGTLREVCEHLKDIIVVTRDCSNDMPAYKEVDALEQVVDTLIEATDPTTGIRIEQVKSITEELYEKVLGVQEELIQFVPQSPNKLAREAKLIDGLDEVESNIAVLQEYNFIDLSQASDITSHTSPQLAIEIESESLMQIDDLAINAIKVVHDSNQDIPIADLMIVEDFFKTCKNEFTILRCLLSKTSSYKKLVRLLQEFFTLQSTIEEFKTNRYRLNLSEDVDRCLASFFMHAEDCLKNVQNSLIKIVNSQSEFLFTEPIVQLYDMVETLKKLTVEQTDTQIVEVVKKLVNVVELTKPSMENLQAEVIQEIQQPSIIQTSEENNLSNFMEQFMEYVEEQTKFPSCTKTNKMLKEMLKCIQKHQDFRDATSAGKVMIILKCLYNCASLLQERILGYKQIEEIKQSVERGTLSILLTEMLEPLQVLHSQLIDVQHQVLSGVHEDLISIDIDSTESLVKTMTEIHNDIIQKIESEETLVANEELSLIMAVDKEIHSIQNTIKSVEGIPTTQGVLEKIKPINDIEEALKEIISNKLVFQSNENLSKEKAVELVQHIDQYIELIEIVEEISAIIKIEEFKETIGIAKELRESISSSEAVIVGDTGKIMQDISTEQAQLAFKLQRALMALHVQVLDSAQELAPVLSTEVLQRVAKVTGQLQADLVAVSGVHVAVQAPLELIESVKSAATVEAEKSLVQTVSTDEAIKVTETTILEQVGGIEILADESKATVGVLEKESIQIQKIEATEETQSLEAENKTGKTLGLEEIKSSLNTSPMSADLDVEKAPTTSPAVPGSMQITEKIVAESGETVLLEDVNFISVEVVKEVADVITQEQPIALNVTEPVVIEQTQEPKLIGTLEQGTVEESGEDFTPLKSKDDVKPQVKVSETITAEPLVTEEVVNPIIVEEAETLEPDKISTENNATTENARSIDKDLQIISEVMTLESEGKEEKNEMNAVENFDNAVNEEVKNIKIEEVLADKHPAKDTKLSASDSFEESVTSQNIPVNTSEEIVVKSEKLIDSKHPSMLEENISSEKVTEVREVTRDERCEDGKAIIIQETLVVEQIKHDSEELPELTKVKTVEHSVVEIVESLPLEVVLASEILVDKTKDAMERINEEVVQTTQEIKTSEDLKISEDIAYGFSESLTEEHATAEGNIREEIVETEITQKENLLEERVISGIAEVLSVAVASEAASLVKEIVTEAEQIADETQESLVAAITDEKIGALIADRPVLVVEDTASIIDKLKQHIEEFVSESLEETVQQLSNVTTMEGLKNTIAIAKELKYSIETLKPDVTEVTYELKVMTEEQRMLAQQLQTAISVIHQQALDTLNKSPVANVNSLKKIMEVSESLKADLIALLNIEQVMQCKVEDIGKENQVEVSYRQAVETTTLISQTEIVDNTEVIEEQVTAIAEVKDEITVEVADSLGTNLKAEVVVAEKARILENIVPSVTKIKDIEEKIDVDKAKPDVTKLIVSIETKSPESGEENAKLLQSIAVSEETEPVVCEEVIVNKTDAIIQEQAKESFEDALARASVETLLLKHINLYISEDTAQVVDKLSSALPLVELKQSLNIAKELLEHMNMSETTHANNIQAIQNANKCKEKTKLAQELQNAIIIIQTILIDKTDELATFVGTEALESVTDIVVNLAVSLSAVISQTVWQVSAPFVDMDTHISKEICIAEKQTDVDNKSVLEAESIAITSKDATLQVEPIESTKDELLQVSTIETSQPHITSAMQISSVGNTEDLTKHDEMAQAIVEVTTHQLITIDSEIIEKEEVKKAELVAQEVTEQRNITDDMKKNVCENIPFVPVSENSIDENKEIIVEEVVELLSEQNTITSEIMTDIASPVHSSQPIVSEQIELLGVDEPIEGKIVGSSLHPQEVNLASVQEANLQQVLSSSVPAFPIEEVQELPEKEVGSELVQKVISQGLESSLQDTLIQETVEEKQIAAQIQNEKASVSDSVLRYIQEYTTGEVFEVIKRLSYLVDCDEIKESVLLAKDLQIKVDTKKESIDSCQVNSDLTILIKNLVNALTRVEIQLVICGQDLHPAFSDQKLEKALSATEQLNIALAKIITNMETVESVIDVEGTQIKSVIEMLPSSSGLTKNADIEIGQDDNIVADISIVETAGEVQPSLEPVVMAIETKNLHLSVDSIEQQILNSNENEHLKASQKVDLPREHMLISDGAEDNVQNQISGNDIFNVMITATEINKNLLIEESIEFQNNDVISIEDSPIKSQIEVTPLNTDNESVDRNETKIKEQITQEKLVPFNDNISLYSADMEKPIMDVVDGELTNNDISLSTHQPFVNVQKETMQNLVQSHNEHSLIQHINEFISNEVSEAIENISSITSNEEIKESVVVAKEFQECVAALCISTDEKEEAFVMPPSTTEKAQLAQKLLDSLVVLNTQILDNAQELAPVIETETLEKIASVITHLKEDLQTAVVIYEPGVRTADIEKTGDISDENSMKRLEVLLREVNENIDLTSHVCNTEDSEVLRNTLDEVQTVIIKLKRDYDGAVNDTLNETLEDLECSVRSVQLQINENSPPEMLQEACATLQLLLNSMTETQIMELSESVTKDKTSQTLLEKCSKDTQETVKLLDNACKIDAPASTNLVKIVSDLNKLKDTIKALRLNFMCDEQTLIDRGIDVTQSLDQVEDKVYSLEKDIDGERQITSEIRDCIITAIHSVFGSISNMRSTISSIQKRYMFENYGKPSDTFLRTIKNVSDILKLDEEGKKENWICFSKSLRKVLNHFEDIKFYINLDKTARIPSDAAFTKIILEDLKSCINGVIITHKIMINEEACNKVQETFNCVDKYLNTIEPKSSLDVKEKIPIFKDIASRIYDVSDVIKKNLQVIQKQDSKVEIAPVTKIESKITAAVAEETKGEELDITGTLNSEELKQLSKIQNVVTSESSMVITKDDSIKNSTGLNVAEVQSQNVESVTIERSLAFGEAEEVVSSKEEDLKFEAVIQTVEKIVLNKAEEAQVGADMQITPDNKGTELASKLVEQTLSEKELCFDETVMKDDEKDKVTKIVEKELKLEQSGVSSQPFAQKMNEQIGMQENIEHRAIEALDLDATPTKGDSQERLDIELGEFQVQEQAEVLDSKLLQVGLEESINQKGEKMRENVILLKESIVTQEKQEFSLNVEEKLKQTLAVSETDSKIDTIKSECSLENTIIQQEQEKERIKKKKSPRKKTISTEKPPIEKESEFKQTDIIEPKNETGGESGEKLGHKEGKDTVLPTILQKDDVKKEEKEISTEDKPKSGTATVLNPEDELIKMNKVMIDQEICNEQKAENQQEKRLSHEAAKLNVTEVTDNDKKLDEKVGSHKTLEGDELTKSLVQVAVEEIKEFSVDEELGDFKADTENLDQSPLESCLINKENQERVKEVILEVEQKIKDTEDIKESHNLEKTVKIKQELRFEEKKLEKEASDLEKNILEDKILENKENVPFEIKEQEQLKIIEVVQGYNILETDRKEESELQKEKLAKEQDVKPSEKQTFKPDNQEKERLQNENDQLEEENPEQQQVEIEQQEATKLDIKQIEKDTKKKRENIKKETEEKERLEKESLEKENNGLQEKQKLKDEYEKEKLDDKKKEKEETKENKQIIKKTKEVKKRLENENVNEEREVKKEHLEKEKPELEQIEKERLEKEQQEKINTEYDKQQKEKLDTEKKENQRIKKVEKEETKEENYGKEKLEKQKLEKVKSEQDKVEKERLENERQDKIKADLEKEKEKKEKTKTEMEEKERLEKDKIEDEKERMQKEQLEKERLEQEHVEKDRLEKEQQEKIKAELEMQEKEKLDYEKKEKERNKNDDEKMMQKEQKEKEKSELEKVEKERLENEQQEKIKVELEKQEKEKLDIENKEKERIQKEKNEKIKKEKEEKDRLEKEKLEEDKERMQKEQLEKEKSELEKVEKERLEKEQQEKIKVELEKQEKEKLDIENKEKERIKKEKKAKINKEKEDKDRLEKEKLEVEKERMQKEQKENVKSELEKVEKERLEKEQQEEIKDELEKQEKEKLDYENKEKERKKNDDEKMKKEKEEKHRLDKEKFEVEKEMMQKEQKEKEKSELEKVEKERLENEQQEKINVELEKQEKEKLDIENKEKERIQKEKNEKIKKEKEEKDRLEKEKLEEDKERMQKEQLEKEKSELEKVEKERLEKEQQEKIKVELEKQEKEKLDIENKEKERIKKEKKAKIKKEKEDKDRLEKEKLEVEKEKMQKEQKENVKSELEKVEKERLEKEQQEEIKVELEKQEKEKLDIENKEKESTKKEKKAKIKKEMEEKDRLEKEKLEVEKERMQKEQKENIKSELEKVEKERLEKEQQEKIKVKLEIQEKENLDNENKEKERIQKEKNERIKKEKEERVILENEKLEKEQNERLKKELLDRQQLEQEPDEKEQQEKTKAKYKKDEIEKFKEEETENTNKRKEKIESLDIKKPETEKERLEKEKFEKEIGEKAKTAKHKERERLEKDKRKKEKLDTKKKEKDKDTGNNEQEEMETLRKVNREKSSTENVENDILEKEKQVKKHEKDNRKKQSSDEEISKFSNRPVPPRSKENGCGSNRRRQWQEDGDEPNERREWQEGSELSYKHDSREKTKFVDHNHRDYTMEFARPSRYRERTFDDRSRSSEYQSTSKSAIIYKAETIYLDSQLRAPGPQYSDLSSDPSERRELRQRSKAFSEARSVVSERRTGSRDLKRKPVFSTYLTDRTAVEGSRVKLTCSALSSTEPTITWYRNGVHLDNKLKYKTMFVNGLITLEVLNAVPSDSAEYSCTVENENGSVSTSANLKVYPSFEASPIPPTFTRSIRDVYHLAEDELVLECRIRGQPLPTISWLKDDRPIFSERHQAYYLADGVCRLAISHPTPEDSGKYTCKAENSMWSDQITHVVNFTGRESRLSPNLATVERSRFNRHALESRRPHFGNVLADYQVVQGGTIGLQVEIRGCPTRVEWLREGCSVTEVYKNARTFIEQGLYTLALSDVTEKESGLYTCRAWSTHGNVDMNAAITVVQPNELDGKPATIIGRPEKDILISVGEDINISFRVQGEPKPKVIFMKGIRDITTSQRVCKMTSDDYVKFTVKRSVVSDAGTYCILARNAYGCDRAFVTVVVRQRASSENLISDWTYPMDDTALSISERKYKSVPDRVPGEPSVVDGGNNWLSLAWSKPDPGAVAPVLAYKVESWLIGKEGGARWVELGITPLNSFDAFNLKQGEEYHFRVTPRNRYGWGEPTQTSTPIGVGLAGARPEFVDILPGQLKVLAGEIANLTCSVKGKPTPEVIWMKNGHEIEEEEARMAMAFNGYDCCLIIKDVNNEDDGRYSCEASNVHGRASTYARLAVVTDRLIWEADAKLKRERSQGVEGEYPPQFTMRLRDRRVQATYPVRLTCQVVGNPPPTVTWYKDGGEVATDNRHNKYQDEHFHTLEIAPTNLDDGGMYEALARNPFGAVSCRCGLVVDKGIRAYVAPEFCCGLEPLYRLNEGEELRISAVVEAYPSVGVTWYRDGVRLRPSRRAIMTLDRDGQIELALAAVSTRDAGVYTCTASNEVGRASTSGKVEVVAGETSCETKPPAVVISPDVPYSKEPMFIRKPRSSEAYEGDTVIIQCEVVGDPKPDVYWLRDFLKPDYYRDASHFKRVGDGPEYRFEIPHAKLDYTGAYSVVARNVHGEAKAVISLQIKVKDACAPDDAHNIRYGRVEVIPRFERNLTDLLSYDGDAVEFECRVSGNPEPYVRWFHYNELIRDCPDFEALYDDGAARLKIKQVTAEDEGTYTCEAANCLGKARSSACLVVYPPGEPNTLSQRLRRPPALLSAASTPRSTPRSTPARSVSRTPGPEPRRLCSPGRQMAPAFYTYPFNKVVEEGESVVFQCAVKGLPAPWATWDKDGIILTPTARITVKEKDEIMRILEIDEVTIEDVGIYRITVENEFGRAEASARLEVISRKGKFYGGLRAYSVSPRRSLGYRRRPSTPRLD